jgi:ATP-dependent Clp protease ATP-binding subunit ClpC
MPPFGAVSHPRAAKRAGAWLGLRAALAAMAPARCRGFVRLKSASASVFDGAVDGAREPVSADPDPMSTAAERLLGRLREQALDGASLTASQAVELGAEVGLSEEGAEAASRELVKKGYLVVFGQRAVFADLRRALPMEDAGARGGRLLALEAVGRLGEDKLESKLEAFSMLEKASASPGLDSRTGAGIRALRDNAGLRALGGAMSWYHESHKGSGSPDIAKAAALAKQAAGYLSGDEVYFDRSHLPPPLEGAVMAAVDKAVTDIQALLFPDLGFQKVKQMTDALAGFARLLSSLRAEAPAAPKDGSPDVGSSGPVLSDLAKFLLTKLREDWMAGESISNKELTGLDAGLGFDTQDHQDAVTELVDQGFLVQLNGRVLLLDLPLSRKGESEATALNRSAALQAAALLAEDDAASWTSAFDGLAKAAANEKDLLLKAELVALRDNAGLGALRRLLIRRRADLQGSETPDARAELASLSVDIEYFKSPEAYFSLEHRPPALRAAAPAFLAKALPQALKAAGLQETALPGLSELVARLANPAQAHPAEDPSRPKPFPLIDPKDKKFKNLCQFGRNLTALAVQGKLTPLIGREGEVERAIEILVQPEKNNPVFTGGPGVGKTKLVEGLAQAIVEGKVPERLRGVNIFILDSASLVAGTTLRGQFEERLKGIIDEAASAQGKVILFIDEIHTIMGLGDGDGATSANSLIKAPISDGRLTIIGATTSDEYRRIERDGALKRRFQEIPLREPGKDEALAILLGIKARYEEYYKLKFPEAGLRAAVELAARYIKDRLLPDSAIDIVRQAGARVMIAVERALAEGREPRSPEVTAEDMAVQLARMTGIPVQQLSKDENERLKRLEIDLALRVKGQGEAISAAARAVRRGRVDLKEENEPVAVFVFLGPTGVGKTELAKALAENQFDSEKNMIRFDMSEFMEKHTVSRLIGAPPGYIGHDAAGELTEKVRKNPYSIVLFDEFEKAHEDIQRILLQIIDDGRLTDSHGNTVDFSNTIIIMTSNVGGSIEGASAQAQESASERSAKYVSALEAKLLPELFGRIGKSRMLVFNRMSRAVLDGILDLRIALLNKKLARKGVRVELTAAARAHLLDDASRPENIRYGARPLKQAIDNEVKDLLADAFINGGIGEGDAVLIDFDAAGGALSAKRGGG